MDLNLSSSFRKLGLTKSSGDQSTSSSGSLSSRPMSMREAHSSPKGKERERERSSSSKDREQKEAAAETARILKRELLEDPEDAEGTTITMSGKTYKRLEKVGRGSYALVYKAMCVETEELVALKQIRKSILSEKSKAQLDSELEALQQLRCPYIVELLAIQETEEKIFIMMEYCDGGDLLRRIQSGKLSEDVTRILFSQLIDGIDFAHKKGYVHRDLKLENLLLKTNDDHTGYNLKIGDWGFAERWKEGKYMSESLGSIHYAAPEICYGLKYIGPEVDVWSMGVCLYAMAAGYLPFEGNNPKAIVLKIRSGKYEMPAEFSPLLKDLVSRLLVLNSNYRANMEMIQLHPWTSLHKMQYGPHKSKSGWRGLKKIASLVGLVKKEKAKLDTTAATSVLFGDFNKPSSAPSSPSPSDESNVTEPNLIRSSSCE
eukprot:TRINITY_DN8914_c0_g1_i2.p1 TRINITY_DN8914_c0_g1~~TRINITY_DN8914_c0_g1_i2.p1  ORF type:complete len:430 (-),score=102.54 TRINITY_DN8914_c0_g1_i2:160-1449(-)